MKRKAKQSGSGGRLRWALLVATAAAFLLVPAAQALANGTMKVNLAGSGQGEVTSGNGLGKFIGNPKIECGNVSGHVKTQCENEVALEEELEADSLQAKPGFGFKLAGWTIDKNGPEEFYLGCEELEPGVWQTFCTPTAFEGEEAEMEVTATFAPCVAADTEPSCVSKMKVTLAGTGKGKVIGQKFGGHFEGTPKMECSNITGEVLTVCENNMVAETAEEETNVVGYRGDNVKATAAVAGPESEFVEWIITPQTDPWAEEAEGSFLNCGTELKGATCLFSVSNVGEDAEVIAVFDKVPVKQPLTLTHSGEGSLGSFECKDVTKGGSFAPCVSGAEFGENDEVVVKANPGTGSEFAEFNEEEGAEACDSVSSNECTVEMAEPGRKVNAKVNLETFELTLATPGGHGSLAAECTPPGGACALLTAIPYGTEVTVTASPDEEYEVASLVSSAAGAVCSVVTKTCEFEMKAPSSVTAEFELESRKSVAYVNPVYGHVEQETALESACNEGPEGEGLNLTPGVISFVAGYEHPYSATCGLTVTTTGVGSTLTASDDSSVHKGHLVQEAAGGEHPHPQYFLNELLEVRAADTEKSAREIESGEEKEAYWGEGPGLTALSPVQLLSYNGPVSKDAVELEFQQWIRTHDPLHTGEYKKTITLTLYQTEP